MDGEKIVFSIEFDDAEADKKMKDLLQTSIELKQERTALDKAFKDGNISMQAYVDKLAENAKATDKNAKATKDLKKDVELADAGRKLAAGSLDQMKAKAAELTKVYNSLSKEQRLNTVEGRKLGAQIKDLNEDIDKGKKAIGKGGFVDALKDAVVGNTKFGQSVNTVGMALKANPIGLIITAISLALSYLPKLFGKSGDGADFFSKKLDQVNAIVEVGFKRINMLGEAVAAVFAGEWSKAAELAAGSVKDLDVAFQQAYDSAGALADQLDTLEVAESNFTVTTAQAERAITQLLIQSKNRTLSEGERIKMLEKAEKLEKELNNNALKLAEERLAIEKANNKLKQEDSDEQLKRENELQIKIEELKTKSLLIEEKIQNRKDELADKAAERAKKRAEELAKTEAAAQEKAALSSIERLEEHEGTLVELQNKLQERLLKAAEAGAANKAKFDEKYLQEQQRIAAEEIRIQQAKVDTIVGLSGALSDVAGAFIKNARTAAGIQKGIALGQIATDTAVAISSLVRASNGNPLNLLTGGAAGVIQFTTGLATILTNIAKAKQLLSKEAPAFADSGLVPYGYEIAGGDGRGKGDNTLIWAKPGEVVLNAKHQAMLGGSTTFRKIGVPGFANSGLVPSDGGLVSRTVSAPVMQGMTNYKQMAQALAQVQIYTKVTDINNVQAQVARVVAVSDH